MTKQLRRLPLLAAAIALSACSDTVAPVSREPEVPGGQQPLTAVQCSANVVSGSVSCGTPSAGGAQAAVLIGNQGTYVRLTSSNIAITADTFAFDVTVQNLLPQPIGTTDINELTPDPNGIRVFFAQGPTSTGAGTISVANPDGVGTFTAANQPYYQYNESLDTDLVSAAKRWKLRFTPEVTNFTFLLYVSTEVPFPNGYITGLPYVLTLNPSETVTLGGTVRNRVGDALPGEAITFVSNAPGVASVSGNQVTGNAIGFAELTATSGSRPGVFAPAVAVCPSVVVTNGSSISTSLTTSDCFSAAGSEDFRPSNEYYGDLYRVTLTAGQTVTVTMNGVGSFDPQLTVLDPAGFPFEYNDDIDFAGGNYNAQVTFVALVGGVYVIEASSSFAVPGDTGDYTLTVTIS